jgi:hypothetical protein
MSIVGDNDHKHNAIVQLLTLSNSNMQKMLTRITHHVTVNLRVLVNCMEKSVMQIYGDN